MTAVTNYIMKRARLMEPGGFAMVMATGVVSINLAMQDMPLAGKVLFWLNVAAYCWLLLITLIRITYYRRDMAVNFCAPGRGAAFLTLVAATCVLATQCLLVQHWEMAAVVVGVWGAVCWFVLIYLFFFMSITRHFKASFSHTINGTWLVVVVSTQSLAVLVASLGAETLREPLFFVGIGLYLVGCAWYLIIITLILYRMVLLPFNAREFTPPYWINMGALAISALAGSLIIEHAPTQGPLLDLLPFIKGFTLFYWANATWWIPLLIMLSFWHRWVGRVPLKYGVEDWDIVFPVAMYVACTRAFSHATHVDYLMAIPEFGVFVSVFIWAIVAFGLCWRLLPWHRQSLSHS